MSSSSSNIMIYVNKVVDDGFEFFDDKQLVTIFSAPNYTGEFDNSGAIMAVDENLMCSFQQLKPLHTKKQKGDKKKMKSYT